PGRGGADRDDEAQGPDRARGRALGVPGGHHRIRPFRGGGGGGRQEGGGAQRPAHRKAQPAQAGREGEGLPGGGPAEGGRVPPPRRGYPQEAEHPVPVLHGPRRHQRGKGDGKGGGEEGKAQAREGKAGQHPQGGGGDQEDPQTSVQRAREADSTDEAHERGVQ
ncbi:unnamed protein product, partial [Ectocarpus fasciculatus]